VSASRLIGSVRSLPAGALLAAALSGPLAGQVTERVSVNSGGTQGNGLSQVPALSADGRYVAFESEATNLVSGDTNGVVDVFVHDRQSGVTERVTVDSLGAEGNAGSYYPSISADGRYVAFWSAATNLVNGDTNGIPDVFVHDRLTGTNQCVSVDSLGTQANGHSLEPSISADGRYVAFMSYATDLVSGDTNGVQDVFVHDRQTGTTQRVSVDSAADQGDSRSVFPSISADGRYVAFTSWASDLVSGDTNQLFDVFVHDRQTGTTQRVSVNSAGMQGSAFEFDPPSISADGRYVAFCSSYPLVSGDTIPFSKDIFVHDRQSGVTDMVSVDSLGAHPNAGSYWASISADANTVAFYGNASNLVSGDTNSMSDVFVHVRCVPGTSATFSGDGINADTIAPVNVVVGSSWSAPLTLGHPHGASGPLVLSVRGTTINGPSFTSSIGGRLTEVLIAGPLLAALAGSHNGVSGDVPPQAIPNQLSLVGGAWAAQYTVIGGGFGDLSQAVFGVVGCQ